MTTMLATVALAHAASFSVEDSNNFIIANGANQFVGAQGATTLNVQLSDATLSQEQVRVCLGMFFLSSL